MNDEIDILKKDLENIRGEYRRAKDVLQKIEDLSARITRSETSIAEVLGKADVHSSSIQQDAARIEEARKQIQASQTEIGTAVESVKGNVQELQSAYAEFSEIKGRVSSVGGEIDSSLKTTEGLKADIERIKADAQKSLENIQGMISVVQSRVNEIQEAYQGFLTIKVQIDDKNTGLAAALSVVQGTQKQANTLLAEIKTFRDESKTHLDEIKANKVLSDEYAKAIETLVEAVTADRAQVESITKLVTDTGFANSFQKRQQELTYSTRFWAVVTFGSIAALAALLIYFFHGVSDVPEYRYILYRVTLTSPLLLLIAFAVSQYSKDRDLTEKYAFKAVISTVLRHHIKFMLETAAIDKKGDTFAFAKLALENTYSEPDGTDISTKKVMKEIENLKTEGADKKHKIRDVVEMAKDLKQLVPDDATLKTILELFVKLK